jgi:hypothetical protein
MKKIVLSLTAATKYSFILILNTLFITCLPQQAKGYNIELCANDPLISIPAQIDLLQPIDQKMINCIPSLDSIASQWKSTADNIISAIDQVKIGNDGENNIEKLQYDVQGKTISLVLKVRAKHTWKVTIPKVEEKVPIPIFKTTKECLLPIMGQTGCRKKIFGECLIPTFGQTGCGKWVDTKIPDGFRMEWRVINPEKTIKESASTTCKYEYTYNLSTSEQNPVFNCGRGSLGNYKLDASSITDILSGKVPTFGKLLTTISFTPPLFKDASRDEYASVKNKIISSHPNSIVYFSSQSFVKWASAKNQVLNGVASVVSGGSFAPELIRQIEEQLRSELTFMGAFTSQTGINLVEDQISSMMTGRGNIKVQGYRVSVEVVNTPEIFQKCIVGGDCIPEIKSPRLGFAIIATRI